MDKMVIATKIFDLRHMVIIVYKFSYFSARGFCKSWRHVALLSELSRCVQLDCTCDDGDAMVFYIEA